MTDSERSFKTLTKNNLRNLKELALEEHEDYFRRNPHLRDDYYESLIGICLCQGAASHYLDTSVGIKDYDIWHFYTEKKGKMFPYRGRLKVLGGYKNKPIDFLKRAIPRRLWYSSSQNPGETIMEYLFERDTYTKKILLEKAVVGLFPNTIFGMVLWRGEE